MYQEIAFPNQFGNLDPILPNSTVLLECLNLDQINFLNCTNNSDQFTQDCAMDVQSKLGGIATTPEAICSGSHTLFWHLSVNTWILNAPPCVQHREVHLTPKTGKLVHLQRKRKWQR